MLEWSYGWPPGREKQPLWGCYSLDIYVNGTVSVCLGTDEHRLKQRLFEFYLGTERYAMMVPYVSLAHTVLLLAMSDSVLFHFWSTFDTRKTTERHTNRCPADSCHAISEGAMSTLVSSVLIVSYSQGWRPSPVLCPVMLWLGSTNCIPLSTLPAVFWSCSAMRHALGRVEGGMKTWLSFLPVTVPPTAREIFEHSCKNSVFS